MMSLSNPLKQAYCKIENEGVVGAAPTGDAPTASEWSTRLLPTMVPLILNVWWYIVYGTTDHTTTTPKNNK